MKEDTHHAPDSESDIELRLRTIEILYANLSERLEELAKKDRTETARKTERIERLKQFYISEDL